MSRAVVHLSDLHFGRVDKSVIEPLVDRIHELNPDVIAVSGDLTQRAKPQEFEQARAFLRRFTCPLVVVPGNHDVPLYDLYGRFVGQFDRFRRYITEDEHPAYADDEIAVVGVNSARSLTWKGGRLNEFQMSTIRRQLQSLRPEVTRVVVTHHPFELPEGFGRLDLVGRSRMAMGKLAECGADILLSGHLHVSHVCETFQRYNIEGHSALIVQAGTALSDRCRGEKNSFNCLRIAREGVQVERWSLQGNSFDLAEQLDLAKTDGVWRRRSIEA